MPKKLTKNNAWQTALTQFNTVSKLMKLPKGCQQILKNFDRVLTVNIPIKMNNGSVESFTGYRVQHNSARGPYKGGARYLILILLLKI